MDIKSMLQGLSQGDDKKKKYIIIVLIILFLLSLVGTSVYFLTRGNGPTNEGDVLSGWEGLAPRGGTATSSLKRLPFIELAADHPTVAPGQESKISWVVSNATACVDGNGDPIDLTGSLSVTPTEPYIFDVLCTGPNGTQSQTITIGVSSAPIIELIATPASVLSGKQSYVSWNTINADRCEDSKGETLRLTGGFSIKPTTPYTYSMSCTGEKGTTKKSITVGITTPFAGGSGTGTSGGSNGSTGNVFTYGTNGTYTDTSTGLTYNSDGTLYYGSSYGIDTGDDSTRGSTGSDYGPSSTRTNLAGKSFILELTSSAPDNIVPFGTTTRVTWKATNLSTMGSCTIRTDKDIGTPYLPLGYAPFSKTVTTHSMTSSETITFTCTKGSEIITKTLTLTVGPPPPIPDPVISAFSVVLEKTPRLDYAATGSTLKVTWKTNHPASKIDKCELWRNDGEENIYMRALPKGETSTVVNEFLSGKHTYAIECSRGEGTDDAKVVTVISTTPPHITFVNCSFISGFGDKVDDIIKRIPGEVVMDDNRFTMNGTRTPTNEPVCTYTYGDKNSKFDDLFKFFNLPRVATPIVTTPAISTPSRSGGLGRTIPGYVVLPEKTNDLCSYTHYKAKRPAGNLITGSWTDNTTQADGSGGYHKNWTTLNYETETHDVWEITGYHYGGKWGTGSRHDDYGWVSRTGVNEITCLVNNNDVSNPDRGIPLYVVTSTCNNYIGEVTTNPGHRGCTTQAIGYTSKKAEGKHLYAGTQANVNAGIVSTNPNHMGGTTIDIGYSAFSPGGTSLFVGNTKNVNLGTVSTFSEFRHNLAGGSSYDGDGSWETTYIAASSTSIGYTIK